LPRRTPPGRTATHAPVRSLTQGVRVPYPSRGRARSGRRSGASRRRFGTRPHWDDDREGGGVVPRCTDPASRGSRWIANGYTHLDGVSDACQITAGSRPRGVEGESLACARVRAKQRGRGSGREGRRPGPIAMSSTRGAGYRRTRSSLACARVRAIERGRRSRRPGTGAIRTQHRPSTTCSFETVPTSLTHGFKPFSRHLVRLDGRTWDRTRDLSRVKRAGRAP
jgi:hypothetical protein